ncbi:MAG: B12-binding domain-containing radical SAM protein [Syntrophomonadaceae bacterium]|nr:B12-binding domain-containing radical SAM protein [Syntrophomonadaceae bacterium]
MNLLLTTLNARFSHSSLALRYLRSYGPQTGWDIWLEEFTINDQIDFIVGEIYRRQAQVVGFSCYIWNITQTLIICNKLKKVAPDTLTVLGGPEVSFATADLMEAHPYIDYVVIGEGEETFKALLGLLPIKADEQRLRDIPGLAYRSGNGVQVNALRPLIADLNQIPSPYGDASSLADEIPLLDKRIVYYETSRGCPFRCQYCLSSIQPGVRYFPLARVKKDLMALMQAGVNKIKFVDRTFNCHRERAREIFQFIIEQTQITGAATSFHFEIGAALLDEDTLKLLETVPVGLFEFEIGVQTLNAASLNYIQRKNDWSQIQPIVQRLARRQNIHLHLDLIAGLPLESYASFRHSFNAVYSLRPHLLQLGFLKLLKGSGLREQAADFGCVFSDQPPYEVLSTKVLGYREILRLHLIEDLVEKYYNSHRFRYALEFLLFMCDLTPFDLFESISFFWEKHGLHRKAHSVNSLYAFLLQYVTETKRSLLNPFLEILKFDFLLQAKGSAPLPWFPRHFIPDQNKLVHAFLREKENVIQYLPHLKDCSVRVILKRIQVEVFQLDVWGWAEQLSLLTDGSLNTHDVSQENILGPLLRPSIVLFDYSSSTGILQQPRYYRLDYKSFSNPINE